MSHQDRTGVITRNVGRPGHRRPYRYLWKPDHPLAHREGYVAEHRYVAWEHGILTDPSHHVHHRNHDTLDNRPENLEALTPIDHARHHAGVGITNQHGTWTKHTGPCSVDGCNLDADTLGMCWAHVTRFRRYGDPLVVRRVRAGIVTPYRLEKAS